MDLCKNCHGGCCRRYLPPLWGSDIIRISEALKVDMFFFITVVKEKNPEAMFGKEPIFNFTDAGQEMYFQIFLKSILSKYYPDVTKCMFLQEWSAEVQQSETLTGIVGRCGIYDIRPINCRTWPAEYNPKEQKVMINDPYYNLANRDDRASDSPGYDICYKPLTKEEYEKYEEQYHKDAILNHFERQFFIEISQKWNRNPDISENFYKFLLKEYRNRLIPMKK